MRDYDTIEDPAIRGCLESCNRLLAVVQSVTPEQYSASWKGHNGIGPHMRHCLEHLTALQTGLDEGTISYDARERNRDLEHDPKACASAIEDVSDWLSALDATLLDAPLTTCQIPQVDSAPTRSQSSLRRELLFVTSHTIHHLAVVSMLAELHNIPLPDRLGVAYSTTTYERARAGQGVHTNAPAP